jgi:hypothetical protein
MKAAGGFYKKGGRTGIEPVAILNGKILDDPEWIALLAWNQGRHGCWPPGDVFIALRRRSFKSSGRVVAHGLEFLIQGSHFDKPCQIASCSHGYGHMRDLDAKNVVGVTARFRSLSVSATSCQSFQGHHQIELFLGTNAASCSENRRDVDDADSPDLHMESGQFLAVADEFAAFQVAQTGDVVTDKAVSPLDEAQDALVSCPLPALARIGALTPMMSTMLPCSEATGANSSSRAMVAALMNFMATRGVRKTGCARRRRQAPGCPRDAVGSPGQ